MRKEGHLHLARPWMGNGRLPRKRSAPQQRARPTTRRKVVPRPPLNLTPHKQRPFYVWDICMTFYCVSNSSASFVIVWLLRMRGNCGCVLVLRAWPWKIPSMYKNNHRLDCMNHKAANVGSRRSISPPTTFCNSPPILFGKLATRYLYSEAWGNLQQLCSW